MNNLVLLTEFIEFFYWIKTVKDQLNMYQAVSLAVTLAITKDYKFSFFAIMSFGL